MQGIRWTLGVLGIALVGAFIGLREPASPPSPAPQPQRRLALTPAEQKDLDTINRRAEEVLRQILETEAHSEEERVARQARLVEAKAEHERRLRERFGTSSP